MQITWSSNPKYQYQYYYRLCTNIVERDFQARRALILPYINPDSHFLPDLDLFNDKEFVEELTQTHSWIDLDSHVISKISNVFPTELLAAEEDFREDKKEFEKRFDQLNEYLHFLFTQIEEPEEIIIIPTKFGTNSSFYQSVDKKIFYITYRLDFGWTSLVQGIIGRYVTTSFIIDQNHAEKWGQRQAIIDFIFANTKIRSLFPDQKIVKTLDFMDAYKGELYEESAKYFAKLGFPIQSCFSIIGETILYNEHPILDLEAKEIEVFKLLLENRNQIVDFDTIAKRYWGDENWLDKFSFTSISKVIEKIRKKLSINNIPNRFIITVRKKGYMLYD